LGRRGKYYILSYAKEIGADESEFKEALSKVPVMESEKFKKIADVLFLIANEISGKAYQNVVQEQLINKLKEATQKAEESERMFSKLFYCSPEPLTVTSIKDGRFIMTNEAFHEKIGYTKEDVLNYTSIELNAWPNLEDRKRWADELKKSGSVRSLELPFRIKNQEIREFLVSSDIIELNKELCTINFYLDITDRKHFESELIKAKEKAEESDQLKTSFLQNMSHEIRTPLNAISGFAGLLNKPDLSEEKRKNFVSIIQNSTNQLLSIITDILSISAIETKQEKLNIEKININSIMLDLLTIFKNQASNQNISLFTKHNLNDVQAEIYSDRTKLTQILSNLLTNALKFTHKGYIEYGYEIVKTEYALFLQFYVKDSGIGITKPNQSKIFERFRQADISIGQNYGGTGLGLSITYNIIQEHKGLIEISSKQGHGTLVDICLPIIIPET